MADLVETLEFLTPYFSTVEEIIGTLSLFVGGIFGLYLIGTLIKFFVMRQVFKSYKEIKEDIARLEGKIDSLQKTADSKKKSKAK